MSKMDLSRVVWRKSRRSGNGGQNCVEVGAVKSHRVIAIRDSKNPERDALALDQLRWTTFTQRLKAEDN